MAELHLWSGLRALADGKEMVEIEGATVGQVLDGLVAAYPGLEPALNRGVSVAVAWAELVVHVTEVDC